MPPHRIIDSHVHLWPASDANNVSHNWMDPGHVLAKQYSVDDYLSAASRAGVSISSSKTTDPAESTTESHSAHQLLGLIYVETDRALPTDSPDRPPHQRWTHPLAELAWLRRLVDGTPREDEGHTDAQSSLVLGLVPWAPVDEGAEVVEQYLGRAREVLGEKAWERVKGWRFLLQGMTDTLLFERVVLGRQFREGVRALGRERLGWVFDVGVDQHSGGISQLLMLAKFVENVRMEEGKDGEEGGQVTFVLNHLCKPNFDSAYFPVWKATMRRLSAVPKLYMKLSGAFSELPPSTPFSASEYLKQIQPWVQAALELFTPQRVMFGSDWPVCTVGGPGDESWEGWKGVVEEALEAQGLAEEEREWVWWKTARKAYMLDVR